MDEAESVEGSDDDDKPQAAPAAGGGGGGFVGAAKGAANYIVPDLFKSNFEFSDDEHEINKVLQ